MEVNNDGTNEPMDVEDPEGGGEQSVDDFDAVAEALFVPVIMRVLELAQENWK